MRVEYLINCSVSTELIFQRVSTNHRLQWRQMLPCLYAELKYSSESVKSQLRHCKCKYTAKHTFLKFKIKIKNFLIWKLQAGPKKVPSYALESSKHPLNLVDYPFKQKKLKRQKQKLIHKMPT
jgi:hypothetical protein